MTNFPEKVLERIFEFLPEHKDRNSVSLVSKIWFRVERWSRQRVFIGNCYAISPERLIARFPNVKALTLKGKPHFADFNLIPEDWGGFVEPWIVAMAKSYPGLEELRLKRMVVTDQNLELISKAFVEFKSLVLVSCDGFSTDGLAAIASNCKVLTELDLQENVVEDNRGDWLSCFPETCTSLISLNFACLDEEVNLDALERLVARCPNFRSLKLNRTVPLDSLQKIIDQAPELVDLGIGSFTVEPHEDSYSRFLNTVEKCSSIRSLSGFWDVTPHLLDAVYPICSNLSFLNLSYAQIPGAELIELIRHCHNLQCLWILDCIGDKGLEIIASTCKQLQELRVFPSLFPGADDAIVTEEGLVAVSTGCPKLHSLLYFCQQMTNAALITVARNCPNFTRFRLCILEPCKPDPVTSEPLDEGFGAIVQSCKGLKRLSLSGLLTDQVFLYIGEYAEQLEMLSVAFSGGSDKGMIAVLNGCKNVRKLEIRDCPFGDAALLADMGKYETMRSLWMSSCEVTLGACKTLAKRKQKLNVEIINEKDRVEETLNDTEKVEKLYVYRTLYGPRRDAPDFVWSL